jgi:putative SOS response-associated peptidase YedK
MCGRYTLAKLADLTDLFPWIREWPTDLPPRYNVAPSQAIPAVTNEHRDVLDLLHWGLIPSWAKDPKIGNQMINARAESLADKPAYRAAIRRRRCLIPADGFYEWKAPPDAPKKTPKQPMYIRMKDGRPFAFAGLWEVWHDPGGSKVVSCTIITTEPNELMRPIHNRMPAILRPEAYDQWLQKGEADPQEMQSLLRPYPAGEMEAYPVSRQVNSPKEEGRHLIEPVAEDPGSLFG